MPKSAGDAVNAGVKLLQLAAVKMHVDLQFSLFAGNSL
jgi:hypothetical protein